jgi:hypothetical protein
MPTHQTLLAFALVSVGLMVIPGPSNLFLLAHGIGHGRRSALAAIDRNRDRVGDPRPAVRSRAVRGAGILSGGLHRHPLGRGRLPGLPRHPRPPHQAVRTIAQRAGAARPARA